MVLPTSQHSSFFTPFYSYGLSQVNFKLSWKRGYRNVVYEGIHNILSIPPPPPVSLFCVSLEELDSQSEPCSLMLRLEANWIGMVTWLLSVAPGTQFLVVFRGPELVGREQVRPALGRQVHRLPSCVNKDSPYILNFGKRGLMFASKSNFESMMALNVYFSISLHPSSEGGA